MRLEVGVRRNFLRSAPQVWPAPGALLAADAAALPAVPCFNNPTEYENFQRGRGPQAGETGAAVAAAATARRAEPGGPPPDPAWIQRLRSLMVVNVPEFEGGCPDRRRTNEGGSRTLKEVHKVGNLTVFASDCQSLTQQPIQLDFHFARGSQGTTHWHGILLENAVFLDVPRLALDFNSRESLAATLEYIEDRTEAEKVFVNFSKSRRDRGELLRTFGFLGFELVRPDDPALPPWEGAVFMVYPMERGACPELLEETLRTGRPKDQDEAMLLG